MEDKTVVISFGGWFNIKLTSYHHRKPHCGDETILRPSYLHNGISYTGKMTSLYWIRAHADLHNGICYSTVRSYRVSLCWNSSQGYSWQFGTFWIRVISSRYIIPSGAEARVLCNHSVNSMATKLLGPGVARSSATISVKMQNKQALVSHQQGFQPPTPFHQLEI